LFSTVGIASKGISSLIVSLFFFFFQTTADVFRVYLHLTFSRSFILLVCSLNNGMKTEEREHVMDISALDDVDEKLEKTKDSQV